MPGLRPIIGTCRRFIFTNRFGDFFISLENRSVMYPILVISNDRSFQNRSLLHDATSRPLFAAKKKKEKKRRSKREREVQRTRRQTAAIWLGRGRRRSEEVLWGASRYGQDYSLVELWRGGGVRALPLDRRI